MVTIIAHPRIGGRACVGATVASPCPGLQMPGLWSTLSTSSRKACRSEIGNFEDEFCHLLHPCVVLRTRLNEDHVVPDNKEYCKEEKCKCKWYLERWIKIYIEIGKNTGKSLEPFCPIPRLLHAHLPSTTTITFVANLSIGELSGWFFILRLLRKRSCWVDLVIFFQNTIELTN